MEEQLKRIKWTITMKLCSLQSFTEQAECAVVIGVIKRVAHTLTASGHTSR